MSTETFPSLSQPAWPLRMIRIGLWIVGTGVLLAVLSGPSYRFGGLGYRPALLVLALGALIALAGALVTAFALVAAAVRRTPLPRVPAAIAIVAAVLLLGYMLAWIVQARSAAMLHEVSTDLEEPPPFVAVAALRARTPDVNPTEYVAEMKGLEGMVDVPAEQRRHYPDIHALTLDVTFDEAFARALRTARELGWQLVAESPEEGRIEATDTTRFFGFKDDIVVRIGRVNGGVRVDVRSKSRVGISDAGTNAKRVRRFLERMQQV